MSEIEVRLGDRSYPILVNNNKLELLPAAIERVERKILETDPRGMGRTPLVITDMNVAGYWYEPVEKILVASGLSPTAITLAPGEEAKSFDNYRRILETIFESGDNFSMVIALGGGVVGDLAGFVAATYKRGVPLVMMPTTLLACVDSTVGGKTGINFARFKNMVGSFYQPRLVFSDTRFLSTLDEREFSNGLAEVVKYSLCFDEEFFRFLEQNREKILRRDPETVEKIILRCCGFKADVVERDEFDTRGIRMALNLGHSFGHAFEHMGRLNGIKHGEAVAVGMMAALFLSEKRGAVSGEFVARVNELLEFFGLPTRLPFQFSEELFFAAIGKDKKNIGSAIRLVLLQRPGKVFLSTDISREDLLQVCSFVSSEGVLNVE